MSSSILPDVARGRGSTAGTAQTPTIEYVEAVGPHVASGCYVLLEADVDAEALESAVGEDGQPLWTKGPITVVRREGRRTPATEIDAEKRAERQGPAVRRLMHSDERRLHRHVRHTFRSTMQQKDDVDREFIVTGFEVVLADRKALIHGDDARSVTGERTRRLTPGVVIVHLDPTVHTDQAESGFFELSADSINYKLSRLLRAHHRQFCSQVQQLLTSPVPVSLSAFNSGKPKRFEPCTALEGLEAARPVVNVLGTGEGDTSALLPIYTVTTVAAESAGRARELLTHEHNRRKGAMKDHPEPTAFPVDALRASRSEALATLRGDHWVPDPSRIARDDADSPALSWRGWHATFTPQGAGFAYVPEEGDAWPQTYRREDLSVVFADLLALEVLKGRILKDFSDRLHRIAENLLLHPAQHETALGIWKEFAVFTTDYAGGVSDVGPAEERFLKAFRQGLSWDADKAIERTQANLDRLAAIARMEQDEHRREREVRDRDHLQRHEQREQKHREADTLLREKEQHLAATVERRFTFFVGFVATLFLPLTVIPPMLEWFYQNPDVSSAGPRAIWTGAGLLLFAIVVVLYWRAMDRRRSRDEEALAIEREKLREMQGPAHSRHQTDDESGTASGTEEREPRRGNRHEGIGQHGSAEWP